MKHFLIFFSIALVLFSCNSQAEKAKNAGDKATAAPFNTRVTQVVGIGKITPENDIIQLSSAVGGVVKTIYKTENAPVKAGEVILELDHQLDDAKVNQLFSETATQAAQITADKAAIEEYQTKYNNAAVELQRLQRLLAKGAETQQTVDNATANTRSLQANINRLQANVEVSKSKLLETNAALTVAKVERDQKIIPSPVNGKLLEISTLIGSAVDSKQPFAQINPEGKTIAVCEIDELFAYKIATGQKAWVRNLGQQDTLSTGTVVFTASFLKKKSLFTDQAGEKEDRRVREIKILLDQPEKLLLNARVECVVDVSDTPKK